MSKDCQVCFETLNKSTRSATVCPFCDYCACRICSKRYLLSISDDACCMNCRKPWDRKIMNTLFDTKFIQKEYKEHRETVLYEKELARLPETQILVEQINREVKITNSLAEVRRQITELKHLKDGLYRELASVRNVWPHEKRIFIQKCPGNNCNGFLNENFDCGLCGTQSCKRCLEIFLDEHKCNPEIVENVKLFKSDTVPCPCCGTRIFKIEGCDQMFCTECHTPFSWKTGRIEKGPIHNPHYFEWLKGGQQHIPRQEGDIVCGRELDDYFVRRFINAYSGRNFSIHNSDLLKTLRLVVHLKNVTIPEQRNALEDSPELRIKFLMNKISKEAFKVAVQRKSKKQEMTRENFNVLTMLVDVMTDIFYKLSENFDAREELEDEIAAIIKYANACWNNIGKQYNCKALSISCYFDRLVTVTPHL